MRGILQPNGADHFVRRGPRTAKHQTYYFQSALLRILAVGSWFVLALSLVAPPTSLLVVGVQAVSIVTALCAIRRTGDLLHPVVLVMALVAVRFTLALPLFLDPLTIPPLYLHVGFNTWPEALAAYRIVGIFVLGFTAHEVFFARRGPPAQSVPARRIKPSYYEFVGLAGTATGVLALLLFVHINFGLGALLTGSIRRSGGDIMGGTGFLFYLGTLTIPSVVLFAFGALMRRRSLLIAIAPALFCAVLWTTLGGRSRAFVHLVAIALLVWHEVRGRRLGRADLVVILIAVPGVLFYWSLVAHFRASNPGDYSFVRYLTEGMFAEVNLLISMAAGVNSGAGSTPEAMSVFLWPFTEFLDIPGRSAGVLFAEVMGLLNPGKIKWGFHATLAGTAYVGVGPWGVLVAAFLTGFAINRLYAAYKRGLHPVVFITVLIYLFRVMFEGPEKWPEMLITGVYAVTLLWAVEVLLGLRRDHPHPRQRIAHLHNSSRGRLPSATVK